MCFGCNPFCGKCKPPMRAPRKCPQCAKFTLEETDDLCRYCGAQLPEAQSAKPEYCNVSGKVCGNPCGQRFKPVKRCVN